MCRAAAGAFEQTLGPAAAAQGVQLEQACLLMLTANADDSRKSEHVTIRALARRTRLLPAIYEPCKRAASKWSTERGVTPPAPTLRW